jgi:Fe-S-cluster containining protein
MRILIESPKAYVDGDRGRMRCTGDRRGEVGISMACAIYAVRPDVCRIRRAHHVQAAQMW